MLLLVVLLADGDVTQRGIWVKASATEVTSNANHLRCCALALLILSFIEFHFEVHGCIMHLVRCFPVRIHHLVERVRHLDVAHICYLKTAESSTDQDVFLCG